MRRTPPLLQSPPRTRRVTRALGPSRGHHHHGCHCSLSPRGGSTYGRPPRPAAGSARPPPLCPLLLLTRCQRRPWRRHQRQHQHRRRRRRHRSGLGCASLRLLRRQRRRRWRPRQLWSTTVTAPRRGQSWSALAGGNASASAPLLPLPDWRGRPARREGRRRHRQPRPIRTCLCQRCGGPWRTAVAAVAVVAGT